MMNLNVEFRVLRVVKNLQIPAKCFPFPPRRQLSTNCNTAEHKHLPFLVSILMLLQDLTFTVHILSISHHCPHSALTCA